MKKFFIILFSSCLLLSCVNKTEQKKQEQPKTEVPAPKGYKYGNATDEIKEVAAGPESDFFREFKVFDLACQNSENSNYVPRTEKYIDSIYIDYIASNFEGVEWDYIYKSQINCANNPIVEDKNFKFSRRYLTNILVIKKYESSEIAVAYSYGIEAVLKSDTSKHIVSKFPDTNVAFALKTKDKGWLFYDHQNMLKYALLAMKTRLELENFLDFAKEFYAVQNAHVEELTNSKEMQ